MQRSAIIAGAGVVGMASAYALARRGWRVTIIDSAAQPAMGASHANGAQLSYCYTDALASPGLIRALPRIVFEASGISLKLGTSPDYLCWLARFASNCTSARFKRNTLAVLELAQISRSAMERLCEENSLDFGLRRAGKVQLIYSPEDRSEAEKVVALKKEHGCEQYVITRKELTQLDAALAGLDEGVVAAVSTPEEYVGDPYRFCGALLAILQCEYGIEARFDASINAVHDDHGSALVELATGEALRADIAVIAAGSQSNRLLAASGIREAIQPMKGYSFEMPLADGSPRVSVTDSKRKLVFTNLGDRMRVAGIADLGDGSRTVEPDRINWLISAARACLPNAGDYDEAGRFWSGLRPLTPDSQPVIRRASRSLAINTGHGALGWTLAMGSGERLADLLDQPD